MVEDTQYTEEDFSVENVLEGNSVKQTEHNKECFTETWQAKIRNVLSPYILYFQLYELRPIGQKRDILNNVSKLCQVEAEKLYLLNRNVKNVNEELYLNIELILDYFNCIKYNNSTTDDFLFKKYNLDDTEICFDGVELCLLNKCMDIYSYVKEESRKL